MRGSEVKKIIVNTGCTEVCEYYCSSCGARAYQSHRLSGVIYYGAKHREGCCMAAKRRRKGPTSGQLCLLETEYSFHITETGTETMVKQNSRDDVIYSVISAPAAVKFQLPHGKVIRSLKSIIQYFCSNLTIVCTNTGERYSYQDLFLTSQDMYYAACGKLADTVPKLLYEKEGAVKIVQAFSRNVPPKAMREAYSEYIIYEAIFSGAADRKIYFGVRVRREARHQKLIYQTMGLTEKPDKNSDGFVKRNNSPYIALLGRWDLAQCTEDAVLYLSNINTEHYYFNKGVINSEPER